MAPERTFPTPTFDELYDCARKLDTCELVLEHIPYQHRRPGLALVVRCTDDGRVVHRAVVRSSVEDAAARIRQKLTSQTTQGDER